MLQLYTIKESDLRKESHEKCIINIQQKRKRRKVEKPIIPEKKQLEKYNMCNKYYTHSNKPYHFFDLLLFFFCFCSMKYYSEY